jgi:hypothetical protein
VFNQNTRSNLKCQHRTSLRVNKYIGCISLSPCYKLLLAHSSKFFENLNGKTVDGVMITSASHRKVPRASTLPQSLPNRSSSSRSLGKKKQSARALHGTRVGLDLAPAKQKQKQNVPNMASAGNSAQKEQLIWNRKIFLGRQRELKELDDAMTANYRAVLLQGSGKTALWNEWKARHANGLFVAGKFDFLQSTSQPYLAIQQALEEIGVKLLSSAALDKHVVEDIATCLCTTASAVRLLVPSLHEFSKRNELPFELHFLPGKKLPKKERNASSYWMQRNVTNWLALGIVSFLTTVCKHMPLVVCIRDIQWADAASITLLESILKKNLPNLLMVITYKDSKETQINSFNSLELKVVINRLNKDTLTNTMQLYNWSQPGLRVWMKL